VPDDDPTPKAPSQRLDEILVTARLQQAMSVAATLGVADQLVDGPRSASDLAALIDANDDALYRLLGTLAAGGILHEDADRRFRLTDVGQFLRSDVPGSRRDWAILNGKAYVRDAWSNLEHSIRTGENAFAAVHGETVWTWRAARPAEQESFDRTRAANSRAIARAVAEAYDFATLGMLVDIGGGTGTLLAAILNRHPSLRGIVFDRPDVVAGDATRAVLERAGVADRVDVVGGNFFESVPSGAGGYLMKSILHDWEDAEAIRILRTIGAAAAPTSTLFVVELVIGAPNEDLSTRVSDLHMLVMPGGRERTEVEWRSLFDRGGFELEEVRPTNTAYRILISKPVT